MGIFEGTESKVLVDTDRGFIAPSLRKAWIERLIKKRKTLKANGSNCADIDNKLTKLGYKEE